MVKEKISVKTEVKNYNHLSLNLGLSSLAFRQKDKANTKSSDNNPESCRKQDFN